MTIKFIGGVLDGETLAHDYPITEWIEIPFVGEDGWGRVRYRIVDREPVTKYLNSPVRYEVHDTKLI